jgi:hypothetical protein
VSVNGKVYRPFIPDWRLKPIALFADSPYTAAVSLFGEGPEQERYFYIQFHDALKDTLLGLRLLQADILLIDPTELWDLPLVGGRKIIGLGEKEPNKTTSLEALQSIKNLIEKEKYQSWVLTDIGDGRIETIGNELKIITVPYYHFWIMRHKGTGLNIFEIQECDQLERLKRILKNVTLPERCNTLLTTDVKEEDLEVMPVSELISSIKNAWPTLQRVNEPVYTSVSQMSQFAALFRTVKATNSTGWAEFLKAVRIIRVTPEVQTPNRWEKPR